MRRALVLCVIILAIATGALAEGGKLLRRMFGLGGDTSPVSVPVGVETHTISIGGTSRTYSVYAPSKDSAKAPVVVAFHGGGQNAMRFATGANLFAMADHYGFVLAMPEGVGNSWNTGMTSPQGYAATHGVDDVGFVRGMLGELAASGRINPKRVYSMGVSEGGMMSYQAACSLPGQFAAIGVVAGTLSSGSCANSQGVSLLHIHGTNDQNVPLNGGRGENTGQAANWASPLQGIQTFAKGESCSAKWAASQLTSDTTCYTTSCPGNDTVEYCLVQGGGHTWPGVASTGRQARQGTVSTMTFSATDMIAQFFLAH